MKLIHGRLDYSSEWKFPDIYLFTGNPTRRKDGAIVMGRGAARQCRDLWPGIDLAYGEKLQLRPRSSLLWIEIKPRQWLGWFKVKNHWSEDANLALIHQSVNELWHEAMARRHGRVYHMNYPGIGNGRLRQVDVMPIIAQLPDNVLIYK